MIPTGRYFDSRQKVIHRVIDFLHARRLKRDRAIGRQNDRILVGNGDLNGLARDATDDDLASQGVLRGHSKLLS